MAKNEKFRVLAERILTEIGGKVNVSNVTHCMTRLRFNLKDLSLPNDDAIKNIPGVLGVIRSGGQYQVIIGNDVRNVYDALCELGGFEKTATIMDDEPKEKQKMTVSSVLMAILDGFSGSVTPAIPVMVTSGFFMMLNAVLGPMMLNVVKEGSDLNVLLTIVGDAGFYFFPVIIAYSAARKFNASPVLAIFLGGILIHPTLIGLATEGAKFSVFGIPATPQVYTHTLVPIVISVWILSHIERFLKQYVPAMLQVVAVPVVSIAVMLPITLVVVGPFGNYIGSLISNGIIGLSEYGGILGIIAIAIIGALWQVFVMTGMHQVLIAALIVSITSTGSDSVVLPGMMASGAALWGMAFGAFLRIKNKEEKSLAFSHFITAIVGGVTEPALYGVALKYKRPFIGMIIGGFIGGLIIAAFKVTCYFLINTASFLTISMLVGGSTANIVAGVAGMGIGFVVAAIVTYFFGFDKNSSALIKTND